MTNKKYTFFWDGPFSQWHLCKIKDPGYEDIVFNCAEQYMMYRKALIMNDLVVAQEILDAKLPWKQKKLGRQIKNFDGKKWEPVREDVVYSGNYLKFTQNQDLLKQLFDTENTIIVEASPHDRIWGVGLNENDPKILDESQWRGLNLLGKILTKLREDLRNEKK